MAQSVSNKVTNLKGFPVVTRVFPGRITGTAWLCEVLVSFEWPVKPQVGDSGAELVFTMDHGFHGGSPLA